MRPIYNIPVSGGENVGQLIGGAHYSGVNFKDTSNYGDAADKAAQEQRANNSDARAQTSQDFNIQKYGEEREMRAMDEMLKDPENAAYIAHAHGVQMTPQIEQMLQNPIQAKLMVEGLKMAKESGLDRPDSIHQFVGGYLQSQGDPMAAMDAVQDKSTLKELYYKTIAARPNQRSQNVINGYVYYPAQGIRISQSTGQTEAIPGFTPDMRPGKPDATAALLKGLSDTPNGTPTAGGATQPAPGGDITPAQADAWARQNHGKSLSDYKALSGGEAGSGATMKPAALPMPPQLPNDAEDAPSPFNDYNSD